MPQGAEYDYLFKLLITGESGAGKSCLLKRFVEHTYTDSYIPPTLGTEFKVRQDTIDGKKVKFHLWEMSNNPYALVGGREYRGAHGILVVHDVTSDEFNLDDWINEIDRYAELDTPVIIVGSKCDLSSQQTITYEQGKAFADKCNYLFIETSAKENINVDKAFFILARKILAKKAQQEKNQVTIAHRDSAHINNAQAEDKSVPAAAPSTFNRLWNSVFSTSKEPAPSIKPSPEIGLAPPIRISSAEIERRLAAAQGEHKPLANNNQRRSISVGASAQAPSDQLSAAARIAMLEREVARLSNLVQEQQLGPPPAYSDRNNSFN